LANGPNIAKLVSVNCGLPREVSWRGQSVTTSIFKEPVPGRIPLRTLNLDGDRQSDLTVHGGKDKAVYCYPIEYYRYWHTELSARLLPFGAFGENFSLDGLVPDGLAEESIHVGDRFSVGSAEVVVTQPRLPCYKLGIRFELDDMVKRFLNSRRTGFYLKVTREGEVGAGDVLTLLDHDPDSVSVSEITRLYVAKEYDPEDAQQVRRAIKTEALPDSWKTWFQEKLNRLNA
jgi:MOSC domain-containing protein YiiM